MTCLTPETCALHGCTANQCGGFIDQHDYMDAPPVSREAYAAQLEAYRATIQATVQEAIPYSGPITFVSVDEMQAAATLVEDGQKASVFDDRGELRIIAHGQSNWARLSNGQLVQHNPWAPGPHADPNDPSALVWPSWWSGVVDGAHYNAAGCAARSEAYGAALPTDPERWETARGVGRAALIASLVAMAGAALAVAAWVML